MSSIFWRFPPLQGGHREGYTNNDIEGFKGKEVIDNLAREICQNSLDAKGPALEVPVKVRFELKHFDINRYPALSEYKKCIDGCKRYWGEDMDKKLQRFIDGAEQVLSEEKIPVLIASDYNTKGLSGSRTGKIKSAWEALTSSTGVSVKEEKNSSGSFGIGKNAPFACSSLSAVFYNTYAVDGEHAFVGVSRLATLLDDNDNPTRAIGKYQNNDDESMEWTPIFEEDSCSFRDEFTREVYGTDIIILGFNGSENWVEDVTKAVLVNFFVAIHDNKLEVELIDGKSSILVNSDTISDLMETYGRDGARMIETRQLYTAFTNPEPKVFLSILEENDVEVYVKSDNSYKRTIANFRKSGMLIGKYSKRILQHYAAVVIVKGEKLGELLLNAEPPRHNRWDHTLIEDKKERAAAKKAIDAIENSVLELLKNQYENFSGETVDAAGIGEYLPDIDEGDDTPGGDDILRTKVKIGKKTYKRSAEITEQEQGKKATGERKAGDVRNRRKHPDPSPTDPTTPVEPGAGEDQGVAPGQGGKIITRLSTTEQRVFPLSASAGEYRIMIKPEQNGDDVYISCSSLGEDGKTEPLELTSLTQDGKHISISKGVAGPISVESDKETILIGRFDTTEKLALNIELTKGGYNAR